MRAKNIGVIGASSASAVHVALAAEVGRAVAAQGWILLCGGLGGVMEAASRGARNAGGTVVGILPGNDPSDGNPFLTVAIATGMGHARNAIIAASADGIIAVGGEHGTLSEIALGLKMGRPVVTVQSWDSIPGVQNANDAHEAVARIKAHLA